MNINGIQLDRLDVSYSSLNLAAHCLRKFEFRKFYPQKPMMDDQFAADVGKAMHTGIQSYWTHGDEDRAYWDLMTHYPYAWEFNQLRDDRSLEAAMATLECVMESDLMDEWELCEIKCPDGIIRPAVEVPFEIELLGITLADGTPIFYTGWIDALMLNRSTGLVRPCDIKTTRMATKDATPKYKFDSQQVPYGFVAEHLQGRQLESFEVLYLECYLDLVDPRAIPYSFPKSREDLQEWMVNTIIRLGAIQRSIAMNYFPRADGGCLSFNRPCYFLNVCETRNFEAITEWLLEGNDPAEKKEWEPWVKIQLDMGL
jgi:hypothetical protein